VVALKDIEAGDELYTDHGSGYFDDLEGGCPCRSCNARSYEAIKEEEYECQKQRRKNEEVDRVAIADKRMERNKKRKGKQKIKSQDA